MNELGAAMSARDKGGLSANALKAIAIIAMVLDHVAKLFLPQTSLLFSIFKCVGRITGPTMFFFIAEGYHRTSNVNRYTLRLGIFALVSYFPYLFAFYSSGSFIPTSANYMHFNVIYTLFLGHLALRARHEVKNPLASWAIVALLLGLAVTADWNYISILFILAFDYFYGDFKKQAFAYSLLTILYIMPRVSYPMSAILNGVPVDFTRATQYLYYFGMFIPIFLLSRYNGNLGKGGKFAKWSFYIIYPGHLLVLGIIIHFLL